MLGKYRLIAEIGRGGMANVYLALSQGPAGVQKLIVVKERRSLPNEDQEFLTMFLDECRLAARLNHPNVVQTYEVGQEGDRFFIAMEYLEGQPLSRVRSRLGQSDAFPLRHHVRVLSDALAGLHYAHELTDFDGTPLHVVHRDVTPQNIFVTYDGQVKLVDFGIAKANDSSSETRTGVLKGKVSYMSPEQARGEELDRRADVFSVGVMLWEAVAKRRMWKGQTDVAILGKLIQGEIPSITKLVPDVDPELARIVDKGLAHQAPERYQTAADMQHDLEEWLKTQAISARDVGKLVVEAFTVDRAEIKSIIDHHVRNLRESSTELARIELERVAGTPSGRKADPFFDDARRTDQSGSSSIGTPLGGAPPSMASITPARRPNTPMLVAIASAVAAVTAIVLVLALRRGPAPATAEPREPREPTPTATASATEGAWVKLAIEGIPKEAKVFVDDKEVGTGPYSGQLPKSDQKHRLRIEAAGYATHAEELTATSDLMLRLALQKAGEGDKKPEKDDGGSKRPHVPGPLAKAPPTTTATATPTATAAPPKTPGDELPTPVKKPARPLDDDNPYAKKP